MSWTTLSFKAIAQTMAFSFLSCVLITVINQASASNKTNSPLWFTVANKHGGPNDENHSNFDCLDKVFAVTTLSGFTHGKHAIEFRWIDPHGETRERTRYDFFIRNKPQTKLWAWLELSRGQGAAMIQWLNPAAGLEEFIGEWKVELLLDGKTINQGEFEISC